MDRAAGPHRPALEHHAGPDQAIARWPGQPDQPWSKAIITNLKQAFFFPGQKDVEASFRKLQLTEYHIEQYKRLDPSRYEVLYWSDGGLRRILRSVADQHTYWLATTDARERTVKPLMKQLHGGRVSLAIEDLGAADRPLLQQGGTAGHPGALSGGAPAERFTRTGVHVAGASL